MVEGQQLIKLKDVSLEKAVLGAILVEQYHYETISDMFHLGLFTSPDLEKVAKCIIRLKNDGKHIDLLSVVNSLKKSDYFTETFTPYEITRLTDSVSNTALIYQHTAILQELFMKRELLRVSEQTIRDVTSYNSDIFDAIDKAEQSVSNITSLIVQTKVETSEELYNKSLIQNQNILDLKGRLVGISSGMRGIDLLTGGWQNSKLIVLAGATSMGKTSLALDFALAAGLPGMIGDQKTEGVPVGVFSLEMPSSEIYSGLQAKVTGIDTTKITRRGLSGGELEEFKHACQKLQQAQIYFDDTSGISIFQLKNKARKMHRLYGIKILFIDYIQLMEGEKRGGREQEVASISRGLKGLAKELNIPIIALSQLSREIEKRQDKTPKLSDLRESGSIEQDADLVCFVYRPEYYGIFEFEGEDLRNKAKWILAKHRGGPLGDVKLDFEKHLARFSTEGIKAAQGIQTGISFEEPNDIII